MDFIDKNNEEDNIVREYTFIRYWVNYSLVSTLFYQTLTTGKYLKSEDPLTRALPFMQWSFWLMILVL